MKSTVVALVGICFVLNVQTRSVAQFDPDKWPRIDLRFSEKGTLKDIFDSGLRPYRFPSLERTSLAIKHVRVTVVCRNGEILPELPAEFIRISPREGGWLSLMELTRYKTTLDEARSLMLPYLAKEGRTSQELELYLTAVKADYLDYDGMGRGVEDFKVRWRDTDGPRFVVAFRKAFDPGRPLIFYMSIDWSQVRTPKENRSFYKEPIPPPLGYENVSMQAPEKFGPDSQADILLSQGKPIAGDLPPSEPPSSEALAPTTPVPTATPARSSPTPAIARSPAPVVEGKSPVWPWVVGIAALIMIVAVVLKARA